MLVFWIWGLPKVVVDANKFASKLASKRLASFVWSILHHCHLSCWWRNITHSGYDFYSSIVFFFGLCVTRIQQSATLCHLFHLATSQTSLCCSDLGVCFCDSVFLSLFVWVWPYFLIIFSFRLSLSLHERLFLFLFPLFVKPAATTKTLPHLLGLDSFPWSNSHKAHRPCRPYGTT